MSQLEANLLLSSIWLACGLGLLVVGLVLAMRSRHWFKRFLGLGLAFSGLSGVAASRGVAAEPAVVLLAIIGGGMVMTGLAAALRWYENGKTLDTLTRRDSRPSAPGTPQASSSAVKEPE